VHQEPVKCAFVHLKIFRIDVLKIAEPYGNNASWEMWSERLHIHFPGFSMQLTRAADYAVRVMILLAGLPSGSRTSREELAQASQVPSHFLSKILQSLARGGLIASYRGASGGFSLIRKPADLTMLDVIRVIDGPMWMNQCVDPAQGCQRQSWCAALGLWVEAQRAVEKILTSASLDELARRSTEAASGDRQTLCVLGGGTAWI
jgi:Rrf2 family protein